MLNSTTYAALQRCIRALRSSQTIGQRLDHRDYGNALWAIVDHSMVNHGLCCALLKGMEALLPMEDCNVGARLALRMLSLNDFLHGLGPWGYYTKERDDFLHTLESMTQQDMQKVLGQPTRELP